MIRFPDEVLLPTTLLVLYLLYVVHVRIPNSGINKGKFPQYQVLEYKYQCYVYLHATRDSFSNHHHHQRILCNKEQRVKNQ